MSLNKELSGVAKISMALDGDEGYTPKNILVTGGAGFIGSHVVTRLVAKYPQYKVRTRRLSCVPGCVGASAVAFVCLHNGP